MHRALCLITFVLLPGAAGQASAQQNQLAPARSTEAGMTVVVGGRVAGKKIDGTGMGSCSHAADTSIHGASASLWKVEYSGTTGSLKQLNLTLSRPKDEGPDQLMLGVETKSGSYRIETGNPGDGKGEGSVTILPSGPGGRLEVRGKEAGGKPVQLTIDCSGFTEAQSEGDTNP